MTVILVGAAILLALIVVAWRLKARREADERLAQITRRGQAEALRFPSMYVGPDTPYGLRSGSACRVRAHKQGSVVEIVTPDGMPWNVRGTHVQRRTGRAA